MPYPVFLTVRLKINFMAVTPSNGNINRTAEAGILLPELRYKKSWRNLIKTSIVWDPVNPNLCQQHEHYPQNLKKEGRKAKKEVIG